MTNPAPIVSARALYNATFDAFGRRLSTLSGWTPDDVLAPSCVGSLPIPVPATPVDAAESVFVRLNADDRPNGRREYSLSVGDVVELTRADGSREWYAVLGLGFDRIPTDGNRVLPETFADVLRRAR